MENSKHEALNSPACGEDNKKMLYGDSSGAFRDS
jgi:hypothetical protein